MKLVHVHCHADIRESLSECFLEFHPAMIALLEEMGIIEIQGETIHPEELRRLHKILRLKRKCGVNTVGAAIIVDLLDKIESLQDEIEHLRRM
ncbi:MAG TPA: chaperone modulator CbpM [Candidatus Limnocylindrales bacterium]|nr:chaperone modulator CbpM [Candidatus Limnocylindrales bacterium]